MRISNNNIILIPLYIYYKLGRCELNKFRIYANPGIYFLKITFDNYNGIIKTNFDTIKINVTGCNENQIKRYNNKILYCENPICHQDCPVSVSAICKPNSSTNNNLINDINNNKCVCLVGWDGENCKNKIILNFRYFIYNIIYI